MKLNCLLFHRYIIRRFFVLWLIVATAGCTTESVPDPPGMPVVYVAGEDCNNGLCKAKLWKDGAGTFLSGNAPESDANDVAVSGSDVYVAGSRLKNAVSVATLWKNNVAVELTTGTRQADATSVFIWYNDVYVGGWEWNAAGIAEARIWKNGVPISIMTGPYHTYIRSVYVSQGIVFACGFISGSGSSGPKAVLWRDGLMTYLTAFNISSTADDLYVKDGDTYVVGIIDGATALWRDGGLTMLSNNYTGIFMRRSIDVAGKDVYVAGEDINGALFNIFLWKNGVRSIISAPSQYAYNADVFLHGSDVYVSGKVSPNAQNAIPVFWKNGIQTLLPITGNEGEANAIFVTGN